MRLRLVSTFIVLALALGATGCAQRIGGTAVAGADAKKVTETSATKSPSSTKSSKSSTPTTSKKPESGDVKITVEKKTEGYEDCQILKPEDIAAAVGGKAAEGGGCVQSTDNPAVVITQMVTFADADGEKKAIEVGGNTAWEVVDKEGDCSVIVMLTDDPRAITPAWVVKVLEVDDVDSCAVALKLATLGFERLPNA